MKITEIDDERRHIVNLEAYVQACESWRHNDNQYGQTFMTFIAQQLGGFFLIWSSNFWKLSIIPRIYIIAPLFLLNLIFLFVFFRLRLNLSAFRKQIIELEKLLFIPEHNFNDSLWPTSYSMIFYIILSLIIITIAPFIDAYNF